VHDDRAIRSRFRHGFGLAPHHGTSLDQGVGKSWLTVALAAQISRGEKLPGVKHDAQPRSVLLLTAEDGAADTIRPRLDAAGADLSKVHVITEPLSLDKYGAAKLKAEIERLKPALVIIDPIVAYLPERTDMNSASAVRPVLARLAKVAEEAGIAIAFVRHLAKGTRDKAIYRGLGSIDFTAACRSVLMVGFDPNDGDKRVVAHVKSNLAAPGPSLAHTLKGGRFAWAGRSSLSAEDLGARPPDADQRSAREEARDFLLQTLADGPKPALDVFADADKQRISRASLRRAKGDLGLTAKKTPDHWEWSLPRPQRDGSREQDAQTSECDHLEHLEASLG
jgi:AAA domain-containing protein